MMMRSHSRDSRAIVDQMYSERSSVTDIGTILFIKTIRLVVPGRAPSLN